MARKDFNETITIPEGVTVTVNGRDVTAKGAKGELTKTIATRALTVKASESELTLAVSQATKLQKNLLFTYKALLKNILQGVNEGYNYKLKICSGHFPMTVGLKGDTLEVKNFIGEKVPRTLKIKTGADVKINGDIIEVDSPSKELAGQVAGDIEKLTKRPGFDKRIFQDGIYIIEKAGKAM